MTGSSARDRDRRNVVFVQTDSTTGNQVAAYLRADDGTLSIANTYNTGGLGGQLNGSVVDHLASQGSLTYDTDHALLYAVNAGSNTVSVFSVRGDELRLRQVISSGGTFPVSIAVHDHLVFVLNALDGGSVAGFRVAFDPAGHLVVANAGNNSLETYALGASGTVTPVSSVGTGQTATCWVASASGFFYTSNAASATLSGYADAADGTLTLLAPPTATDPGTVDAAASADGHFLYVQTGANGIVDEFQVNSDGSLTSIGSVTVAGSAGGEGIFAA
jgi:6-phosphogluconolactonase (cycloisomerase 2 family)